MWYRSEIRCTAKMDDGRELYIVHPIAVYTFQANNLQEAIAKTQQLTARVPMYTRDGVEIIEWDQETWFLLQYCAGIPPHPAMDERIETTGSGGGTYHSSELVEMCYGAGRSLFFTPEEYDKQRRDDNERKSSK